MRLWCLLWPTQSSAWLCHVHSLHQSLLRIPWGRQQRVPSSWAGVRQRNVVKMSECGQEINQQRMKTCNHHPPHLTSPSWPDHRPFVHIVADTSSVSADKAQCATLLLASRGENKQLWTTAPYSYHQFISQSGHRPGLVCWSLIGCYMLQLVAVMSR